MKIKLTCCAATFALLMLTVHGKTWLRADGRTDTYTLINSVLGGRVVETPDCAHSKFGPHITQQRDRELKRPVFVFHIHVTPDNDACTKKDRQRIEIRTAGPSPRDLSGFTGETVTFSWNFRLDSNFQTSSKFCHIHQLKAKGGDSGSPIITISVGHERKQPSRQILIIIHKGINGGFVRLKSDDLSKYAGKWIHAREEVTYGRNGKYSLVLSRLDNGQILLALTNSRIDIWRKGAEFVRPKWGIYRSLEDARALRDERVYFDNFCLGKGTRDKCT